MLPFSAGFPLLTKTSLTSLLDLHPFFYTLMKVSQPNTATESGSTTPTLLNGSAHHEPLASHEHDTTTTRLPAETATSFVDRIMELDFLEELSI